MMRLLDKLVLKYLDKRGLFESIVHLSGAAELWAYDLVENATSDVQVREGMYLYDSIELVDRFLQTGVCKND